MSIQERKNLDGSTSYRVRWREPGSSKQYTKTFRNKTMARDHLRRVLTDAERGKDTNPKRGLRTLGDFAKEWMEIQQWRASTRERTESIWRTHVEPELGGIPLRNITKSRVQAFVAKLGKEPPTGKGLAPATVEGVLRLAVSILTAAVDDGEIDKNPATTVKLPTVEGTLRVPLTREQVQAIADKIDPRLRLAVDLAAATGLRQGELFGLEWAKVHFLKREIVIDAQLVTPQKGEPTLGPVKTARSVRTVPLPKVLVDDLSRHMGTVAGQQFVFMRDGKPWRRSRAADAFNAAAKAAKVDASGWHALRHYCASVLIREGLSVTAVAATLGHSPTECLRTYAGWWPSEDEVVRKAMERAIASGVKNAVNRADRTAH